MTRSFVKATILAVAALSASAGIVNCSSNKSPGEATEGTNGTVGLALEIAPGVTISTVNYHITGPNGFVKDGTIDVANSTQITAVISGLPAGTGYTITLTASNADAGISCIGSAQFEVIARTTTTVTVHLTCQRPKTNGSILVNGTVNICPVVDSVSATAPNSGVVTLSAAGSDLDSAPQPLAFTWAVVSGPGTLNGTTGASTTLTCTGSGTVNVSATVTDGDNVAGCPDTLTIPVSCSPAATTTTTTTTTGGDGGLAGAGGSGGAGGTGGGGSGGSGGTPDAGGACVDQNCLACETAQCPDFILLCSSFASATDRDLCNALVACVRRTSCHTNNTLDCYCGTADATQCLATTGTVANGACKAEIEAAQKTTAPLAIQNQFTDITIPGGAAMSLMLCDNAVCAAECIPYTCQ